MLIFVADIAICFFAVIGVTFSAIILFDVYTAKRAGLSVDILINSVEDTENCEYAVRILQSLLNHSVFGRLTRKVTIRKDSFICEKLPEKLFVQYENLKKED